MGFQCNPSTLKFKNPWMWRIPFLMRIEKFPLIYPIMFFWKFFLWFVSSRHVFHLLACLSAVCSRRRFLLLRRSSRLNMMATQITVIFARSLLTQQWELPDPLLAAWKECLFHAVVVDEDGIKIDNSHNKNLCIRYRHCRNNRHNVLMMNPWISMTMKNLKNERSRP